MDLVRAPSSAVRGERAERTVSLRNRSVDVYEALALSGPSPVGSAPCRVQIRQADGASKPSSLNRRFVLTTLAAGVHTVARDSARVEAAATGGIERVFRCLGPRAPLADVRRSNHVMLSVGEVSDRMIAEAKASGGDIEDGARRGISFSPSGARRYHALRLDRNRA